MTAFVTFSADLAGHVSNLRIAKSSGNASFDNSLLVAIEKATPFRPLPDGAGDSLDMQFGFDQLPTLGATRVGKAWDCWVQAID